MKRVSWPCVIALLGWTVVYAFPTPEGGKWLERVALGFIVLSVVVLILEWRRRR